ncbi:thiamine ABC transporter substrate-binding protein, partial [Salmonella enterica subsp. enterica serovar Chester]
MLNRENLLECYFTANKGRLGMKRKIWLLPLLAVSAYLQ